MTVDGGTGAPLDGTSFAAPLVAGLVALIRERRPDLDAREVIGRITATARRPPAGRDDAVGAGVVDVVAALTAEPGPPARAGATAELARPAPARPPAAVWPLAALAALLTVVTAAAAALRREASS